MIRITNIRNTQGDYDEVWAIVRSLKSKSDALKQVTELSPSTDLFFRYRNLVKDGQWNKDSFDKIYVPQFISEIRSSSIAVDTLGYLYQQDKMGKNICLVCFCTEEELCHRSIIAGLLQGVGANVVTDTGNDYSHYFDIFKKGPDA